MNEKVTLIIYALLVSIVSVLTPVIPLMMTVAGLIIVDTAFGVAAAYKRKERVTSKQLS